MERAGCMLEVRHAVASPLPVGDLSDTDAHMKWLLAYGEKCMQARIACVRISEELAEKIVQRLWPGEALLGATCGQAFHLDTAVKIAIANEVLGPSVNLVFSEAICWSLQTWPEVIDSDDSCEAISDTE